MRTALTLALILLAGATTAHADARLTLTPTSTECVLESSRWTNPDLPPITYSERRACTTPVTLEAVRRVGSPDFAEQSLVMSFQFTYADGGLPLSGPTGLDPGDTLWAGQPAPDSKVAA